MSVRTSTVVLEVLSVFREVHGDVLFTMQFVAEVANEPSRSFNGVCDFSRCPPEISIRNGLSDSDLLEVLCHEFAHLACGLDAGHNSAWEECRDDLSVRVASRHIN